MKMFGIKISGYEGFNHTFVGKYNNETEATTDAIERAKRAPQANIIQVLDASGKELLLATRSMLATWKVRA